MPRASPFAPSVRAKVAQCVATCIPVVPRFRDGARFHVRRVGAVLGFCETEGDDALALEAAEDELLLLRLGAEFLEHGDEREIAHDRVLVLKVVVEAEALCREMLADHRHPEVGAILAAVLFRCGETPVAGGVGAALGFGEEGFPFRAGKAVVLEIGARPFAAVVEVADVIVRALERPDLCFDEGVKFGEIGDELGGQIEIHGSSPRLPDRHAPGRASTARD